MATPASARFAELSISIPNVANSAERLERYLLSDDHVLKRYPGADKLEENRSKVHAEIAGMTELEMEHYYKNRQTGKGAMDDNESRFAKTEDIVREQEMLRPYMVGGGYEASGMYIDTPDTVSPADAAFRAETMRLRMVGGRRYDATGVYVPGNVNGGGDSYFDDDKYYTAEGEYVGGAAIDENETRAAKGNKIGGFSPDPQVMQQSGGAGSWAAMTMLALATIAMACVPRP